MSLSVPSWTSDVRREVLPNGLTLLVQRDSSAPVAAVVTHVKAGFFDEPDRWVGISHVLEHMFFKGTPTRGPGQIARETKAVGGYLNASTSYDHTSYFAVLPCGRLKDAIAIQGDALMHAAIDGEELARELQVIIQEAKRKLDDVSSLAWEHAEYHALRGATLYAMWTGGQVPRDLRNSLRQALRLDDENVRALYTSGLVLKREGRLRDAARYFKRVVAADPGHVDAKRELHLAQAGIARDH